MEDSLITTRGNASQPNLGGWDEFQKCCDFFSEAVAGHMSPLRAPPAARGVSSSTEEMLFTTAFEVAIENTRSGAAWDRMSLALQTARQAIPFVPPGESFAMQSHTEEDGKTMHPRRLLECFARCYALAVASTGAAPPHPAVLYREFERCRSAWTAEFLEYDAIFPIDGVHYSGFDNISLSEDISVGPTHFLLDPHANRQVERFPMSPWLFPPMTSLVRRCRVPKSAKLDDHRVSSARLFVRMVQAFRLATGKPVAGELMYFFPGRGSHQTFSLTAFFDQLPACQGRMNQVSSHGFSEREFEMVRSANTLLGKPTSQQAAIAIERFSWSFGKHAAEDKVIDLAIALESLLCRGNDKAQLSFRFRLFGAAILAGLPGHEHAEDLLRDLYDARSSIVHGGKRLSDLRKDKLSGFQPREFIERCQESARHIILSFLKQAEDGCPPNRYLDLLQESMIRCAKAGVAEIAGAKSTQG